MCNHGGENNWMNKYCKRNGTFFSYQVEGK